MVDQPLIPNETTIFRGEGPTREQLPVRVNEIWLEGNFIVVGSHGRTTYPVGNCLTKDVATLCWSAFDAYRQKNGPYSSVDRVELHSIMMMRMMEQLAARVAKLHDPLKKATAIGRSRTFGSAAIQAMESNTVPTPAPGGITCDCGSYIAPGTEHSCQHLAQAFGHLEIRRETIQPSGIKFMCRNEPGHACGSSIDWTPITEMSHLILNEGEMWRDFWSQLQAKPNQTMVEAAMLLVISTYLTAFSPYESKVDRDPRQAAKEMWDLFLNHLRERSK